MYIGRWLGLNKVIPLCAVEGDRLSVGIAPLIFKLGSRRLWVVKFSAQANLLPESKLYLEAGWELKLVWLFWRRDSPLAPATT